MRILNLRDRVSQDIEVPLARLAASENPLDAFRGSKLLELVRYLQSQGLTPELNGSVFGKELWLLSRGRVDRVSIKVWVDWKDYAPLLNGLPESHYRFQIKKGDAAVTQDARAVSPGDAEDVIWMAFGWKR